MEQLNNPTQLMHAREVTCSVLSANSIHRSLASVDGTRAALIRDFTDIPIADI